MKTAKINKENLEKLFNKFIEIGVLIAPKKESKKIAYKETKDPKEVIEIKGRGDIAPTKAIFPQTSTIFKFKIGKNGIKIEESKKSQDKEIIIWGVSPCDGKAFEILDKVFLKDFVDRLYKEKRDKTVIIGKVCECKDDFCFCTTLGIDPTDSPCFDIQFLEKEGFLYFKGITDKGESFLNKLNDILEEEKEEVFEDILKEKRDSLGRKETKFDLNKALSKLEESFDSKIWQELSTRCISCGICTYLCPSCHCFDIQDQVLGLEGRRYRVWDSCQFPEYSLEASGVNPRGERGKRIRNRLFHKFVYMRKTIGEIGCVGCGRCEEACPYGISIIKIINRLLEEGEQ